MKEVSIEDDNNETTLIQLMNELIDVCTLGVCFEVHKSLRLGNWELLEEKDEETQKEYELINQPGLDVFGQVPVKKQQDCICPNCSRTLAAIRFAPHLEKCMGMGRNSSRIASKRLRGQGAVGDGEFNDDNDVDYDWFEYEKKSRKRKDKDKLINSPKRNKGRKGDGLGLSNLVTNGNNSRPGTPCSTGSGEISSSTKAGPTLQALEELSQEEKVALLTQTCGAISEHTGKMCTRTGKCVQHTDEQRKTVRELLLGDIDEVPWPPAMRGEGINQLSSSLDQDDIHVDVDGYEDMDGGNLLRELTPLSWEQESNLSTGSDTMSGPPPSLTSSPSISKSKKSKNRKARMK